MRPPTDMPKRQTSQVYLDACRNRPRRYRPALERRHREYEQRLAAVRLGLAAGKRHKDIAAELGISRQRVTQLAGLVSSGSRGEQDQTRNR